MAKKRFCFDKSFTPNPEGLGGTPIPLTLNTWFYIEGKKISVITMVGNRKVMFDIKIKDIVEVKNERS